MEYFAPSFRVVAYDMRGHGQSEAPRGSHYTFEEFLGDLERLVEALELPPRFSLLGHSFGGALAAAYAVRHPERVEQLVLLATAGRISLAGWVPRILLLPAPVLEVVRRFFPNRLNCSPAVLKKLVPTIIAWRGWDLYDQIRASTLALGGEWDLLTPPRAIRAMARKIPGSLVEFVRNAGHLPQLERPAATNRILERFLVPAAAARSWRGPLEEVSG
jgi:long-chain acyl-CoA synthetase